MTTRHRHTVSVDDDFRRDVEPEEKERRRLAYGEAKAESAAFEARLREEASATS